MKYLVETLGDFALVDLWGGQEIQAYRPSVVKPTQFIEGNRGTKLRILAELSDEAEDSMLDRVDDLEKAIAALPTAEGGSKVDAPARKTAPKKAQ